MDVILLCGSLDNLMQEQGNQPTNTHQQTRLSHLEERDLRSPGCGCAALVLAASSTLANLVLRAWLCRPLASSALLVGINANKAHQWWVNIGAFFWVDKSTCHTKLSPRRSNGLGDN